MVAMAPSADARMTVSSDQPKRKAGSGPNAFEDVGEHAARPRHRRGQLGVGERAEQRDEPAHHPGQQDRARLVQRAATPAGTRKMPLPMVDPTSTAMALPEAEVAGEPLAPGIALGMDMGVNIALTRRLPDGFFPGE